jgi:hypothetical protein
VVGVVSIVNRWLRAGVVVACFVLAGAAAVACDDAWGGGDGDGSPAGRVADGLPVVVSVRVVCRLAADSASARAAQITGLDGTQSAVAGGRTYWFFGDTVRTTATSQDVIPAAVATSTDGDAADCIDLEFKQNGGFALPLFPRLDETTAWPDGVLALDDGSLLFYMVKAIRTSPFAWHVGDIGLGRVEAGTTEGVRLVEKIWGADSEFGAPLSGASSPVRIGDEVFVYLRTDDGRNLLARAPLARVGETAAYTYWDGDDWSAEPSDAEPMWATEPTGLPADNGLHVTFDDRLGTWLAVYNGELARFEARTADNPWGPWSEPVVWFDCRPFVREGYPWCYSAQLHRSLSKDDGATAYVTFSSHEPYDVTMLELTMGAAVREWRDDDGRSRYAVESPGDAWRDAGVAFYAATTAGFGLSPVVEREDGDGYAYAIDDDAGGAAAFYAYVSPPEDGAVRVVGVHASSRDGVPALTLSGDGDPIFYVPCAGVPAEVSGCE